MACRRPDRADGLFVPSYPRSFGRAVGDGPSLLPRLFRSSFFFIPLVGESLQPFKTADSSIVLGFADSFICGDGSAVGSTGGGAFSISCFIAVLDRRAGGFLSWVGFPPRRIVPFVLSSTDDSDPGARL